MALYFFSGNFESLSSTITNPYSGDIYVINGTYLVNNEIYTGTVGEADTLLMTVDQETLFLLSESGDVVLDSIETVLGSNGSDIFNLASTVHFLDDIQINAGNGDDLVWSNVGNDHLTGNNGNDILHGGPGNDLIEGNDDNDILKGGEGDDTLDGGTGDDVMEGGVGSDTYIAGDGNDTITESASADINVIELPTGIVEADLSYNFNGNDLEITVGTSGVITIIGQYDAADSGIDTLNFSDGSTLDLRTVTLPPAGPTEGDDILEGTSGDDVIDALGGDDVINGLEGNDTLIGGAGADTLNGGADTDTADYSTSTSAVAVDLFSGVGLSGDAAGDSYISIENVTGSDLVGEGDFIIADNGNNTLQGLAGDDTFEGMDGADAIDGGDGSDTAVYWNSYAAVQVDLEAGTASGGHAQGDILTSVENITGSSHHDVITGDAEDNFLNGFFGNDTLNGGAGSDTLDGEAGNDILSGGSGSDIYVAGVGDDTVIEGSSTDINIINIPVGVVLADLSFNTVGNNLEITVGTSGSINIIGQYDAADSGIDTLHFSDGSIFNLRSIPQGPTEGDDTLDGTSGDDVIDALGGNDVVNAGDGNDTVDGGEGNDTLNGDAGNDTLNGGNGDDTLNGGVGDDAMNGGAGSDTYIAGDGNDTITESASADINVIELPTGIVEADLSYNFNGNDLEITVGTSGVITIIGQYDAADSGIDTLNFSDGSTLDLRTVTPPTPDLPTEGDDVLDGTSGDDVIDALGGDDVVNGGAGNDTLSGGAGDDAVNGGAGNDIVSGGLGVDSVNGGDGDDTLLYVADAAWSSRFVAYNAGSPDARGTGERVRLSGSNRSHDLFDGGDGFDTMQLTSGNDAIFLDDRYSGRYGGAAVAGRITSIEQILAGDGNDIVDLTSRNYSYGDVIIDGGNGDDHLWASSGNDTLIGGAGNDSLFGGSGNDQLFSGIGNDRLDGGSGDDTMYGDLGHDRLNGGDGNDQMFGGEGKDRMNGGDGLDTMSGGAGNDRMDGNNGNDQLFGGDGRDRMEGGNGDDQLFGEDGNDRLYGENGDDLLVGGDGNDYLSGGRGNDFLHGGNGSDRLYGGDGNDLLEGQAGNDRFYGGRGDDTYLIGEGADSVYMSSGTDQVIYTVMDAAVDTIRGFKTSQGDSLDIADILQGYDELTDAISDFVQLTHSGSKTALAINADGDIGGTYTTVAVFRGGLSGENVSDLINDGHLIVT